MANATYEVLEFRAEIHPDGTDLFILCGPTSDGTIGVQGWHHKRVDPGVAALPALANALQTDDYLTGADWNAGAPSDRSFTQELQDDVAKFHAELSRAETLVSGLGVQGAARAKVLFDAILAHFGKPKA